jgi:hypothetical protein
MHFPVWPSAPVKRLKILIFSSMCCSNRNSFPFLKMLRGHGFLRKRLQKIQQFHIVSETII